MKNKKSQVSTLVVLFGILGILITLALLFVEWIDHRFYERELKECKDYQTYGYVTEWKGSCDDFFDCEGQCLVYMNDETKLPLNDFKTMSIKEAMVR